MLILQMVTWVTRMSFYKKAPIIRLMYLIHRNYSISKEYSSIAAFKLNKTAFCTHEESRSTVSVCSGQKSL